MSRAERAGIGILTNLLNYGLFIVVQFSLAPIVLKMVGQEVLGAYAIIVQIIGYLILIDMGFNSAFIRYLSYADGFEDNNNYFNEIMNTGWNCLTIIGIFNAVATSLLAFNIGKIVKLSPIIEHQACIALLLLAGWGLIRFPLSVFGSALPAIQDMAYRNCISALSQVMRLIFSLVLIFYGLGLVGLILGSIMAEVIELLICRWRFNIIRPWASPRWQTIKWDTFKEIYFFGLQAMLIILSDKLILLSDNIVVGYLFGSVASSIYYTTQMPATMGNKIVFTLFHNSSPALNQMQAQNDQEGLKNAFLKLQRYALLLILPFSCSLIVLNSSFVTLWVGSAQYGGQLMTLWLALFSYSIGTRVIGEAVLIAKGCIGVLSVVLLIEGLFNLGLSLWLGRKFGLHGIALATLIASIISWSYVHYRVHQELLFSFKNYITRSLSPAVLVTLIYVPILLSATKLYTPNNWGAFILVSGIAIFSWVLISFFIGMELRDRTLVTIWLQKLFSKTVALERGS